MPSAASLSLAGGASLAENGVQRYGNRSKSRGTAGASRAGGAGIEVEPFEPAPAEEEAIATEAQEEAVSQQRRGRRGGRRRRKAETAAVEPSDVVGAGEHELPESAVTPAGEGETVIPAGLRRLPLPYRSVPFPGLVRYGTLPVLRRLMMVRNAYPYYYTITWQCNKARKPLCKQRF